MLKFTMNMDSLWIDYYTLIISTIFYLLYLKFANFSKKAKESNSECIDNEEEDDTEINHSEDENYKNNDNQQTMDNIIKPTNFELTEAQEINPNIDEMITSLNLKLKSISNPNKHHHHHLTDHHQNEHTLHHKQQRVDLSQDRFIFNTQSTPSPTKCDYESLNHLHPNSCSYSRLHKDDTFEIGQLTDSEYEYETDNSSIMTSSPRSTLNNISPKHKIKAMPVLSRAYNEIFQFTLSNTNKNVSNDSYYDTAEFDDESEYDTDDVNNYDNINKQLRSDVNFTLYKIADNHCITPPSTQLFESYGSLSKTCSIGSIGSDDTFHAPSTIKQVLSALSTNDDNNKNGHNHHHHHHQHKHNEDNIGFISSQSTSPYNMHRSQHSGGSTESGSDFYDKFISENYDEFLLNEEYSSSDRNCIIDHHRMESHDSLGSNIHNRIHIESDDEEEEDIEVDLKDFKANLTQFPREEDVYPTFS